MFESEQWQEAIRKAVDECPELSALFPSSPAYNYYDDEKGNEYFWTTERCKCKHGSVVHFIAGIYRHIKTKKQLKLSRSRCFSKKWKAQEWAYQQWCKATGETYTPVTSYGAKEYMRKKEIAQMDASSDEPIEKVCKSSEGE